jgi:hypothetical protein
LTKLKSQPIHESEVMPLAKRLRMPLIARIEAKHIAHAFQCLHLQQ